MESWFLSFLKILYSLRAFSIVSWSSLFLEIRRVLCLRAVSMVYDGDDGVIYVGDMLVVVLDGVGLLLICGRYIVLVPYCGCDIRFDIVLDYLGWILFVLNLWGKTKDQTR